MVLEEYDKTKKEKSTITVRILLYEMDFLPFAFRRT
jgi:hypothetical protein